MKLAIILASVFILAASADGCGKKKYKGRLEIKGICSNYTIALLEGEMDTALISASWTDDHANKSYTNVFGLGNPCQFPDTIDQGEEFYFVIDTSRQEDCMVCMAYYPTPPRKLNIKVVKE
jgi:hypothetical protein